MINELSIAIKLHNANSWTVKEKYWLLCLYYYIGGKVEAESNLESCYVYYRS